MLGQQSRIDQHSVALHPEQHIAHRNLDVRVHVQQLRIALDRRIERAMQPQRDVRVLGGVVAGALDGDLLERNPVHAFAGDLVVRQRLDVEVAHRQVVHVVRPVRLDDVRLEQRVVRGAGEHDAVIGKRVLIVLDVLADLLVLVAREPRRERRENAIAIELIGRAGVAMSDGDVASMPRLDAQRDADDFGVHRIEARRLGIERRELRRLNCCQPSRKRLLVVDDFVARFKWRRRARIRRFVRIPTPPVIVARRFFGDLACGIGRNIVAARQIAQPHLEFETLIQLAQRRNVRGADNEIGRLHRQIAIGLDGQQPPALRQPFN